jgi:membrane-bound serine protease (ClpP class)
MGTPARPAAGLPLSTLLESLMDALISDPFFSGLFVVVGLILVVLEVFIPSAGILSVTAAGSILLGVWGFFHQNRPFVALASLGISLAFVVLVVRWALRRFQLSASLASDAKSTSMDADEMSLVGQSGVCVTALRPAGLAHFGARRVDVVSSGKFIEKNRPVIVVEATGNRIVVREVEDRST